MYFEILYLSGCGKENASNTSNTNNNDVPDAKLSDNKPKTQAVTRKEDNSTGADNKLKSKAKTKKEDNSTGADNKLKSKAKTSKQGTSAPDLQEGHLRTISNPKFETTIAKNITFLNNFMNENK